MKTKEMKRNKVKCKQGKNKFDLMTLDFFKVVVQIENSPQFWGTKQLKNKIKIKINKNKNVLSRQRSRLLQNGSASCKTDVQFRTRET